MPLTLAIGYKANGRTAEPTCLYCGNDATAAAELVDSPPVGFTRAELIKAPPVQRRRHWPDNTAPTNDLVDDPQAPLDVEPPEDPDLLEDSDEDSAPEKKSLKKPAAKNGK